jgi:hypothetical protein
MRPTDPPAAAAVRSAGPPAAAVRPATAHAPAACRLDGRQSEAALRIRRGTGRLLRALGFVVVPELTLASGRRADLMALGPKGAIWIVEIKSSVEDFRCDAKWSEYKPFCDQLFFATQPAVPLGIFPAEEGLIVSDGYAAEMLRSPMPAAAAMPAASRKALLMRIAQTAARRLHDLEDPGLPRSDLFAD